MNIPKVRDVKISKATEQQKADMGNWPIWTCGVSTFDWDYTQMETCLILQGKVTVKDRPGDGSVSFGAGDVVVFPEGLRCTWCVHEPVKKHYNFD